MKYFQCELTDGDTRHIAWIEERGAVIGLDVEVPELGGYWRVVAVYEPGLDKKELSEMNTRKRRGFNSIVRDHAS